MEFAGKCTRFLVETAEYSVPNIVIPVHRLMVFIAINKSPYVCLESPHTSEKPGIKLPNAL